jgi:hypothetical protein
MMMMIWFGMLCGLVGSVNILEKHTVSIFSPEDSMFLEMLISTYESTWWHNPEENIIFTTMRTSNLTLPNGLKVKKVVPVLVQHTMNMGKLK